MKEKMTISVKLALTVLLLAVFTVVSAGTAQARPKWFGVKIQSWKIVQVENITSKPGAYALEVSIRHTNDNEDRVVTNIYDKTGSVKLQRDTKFIGKITLTATVDIKSTKNTEVNLTPGESTTLTYRLPIKKVTWDDPKLELTWDTINVYYLDSGSNEFPGKWKIASWKYDCSVKSSKE